MGAEWTDGTALEKDNSIGLWSLDRTNERLNALAVTRVIYSWTSAAARMRLRPHSLHLVRIFLQHSFIEGGLPPSLGVFLPFFGRPLSGKYVRGPFIWAKAAF